MPMSRSMRSGGATRGIVAEHPARPIRLTGYRLEKRNSGILCALQPLFPMIGPEFTSCLSGS